MPNVLDIRGGKEATNFTISNRYDLHIFLEQRREKWTFQFLADIVIRTILKERGDGEIQFFFLSNV